MLIGLLYGLSRLLFDCKQYLQKLFSLYNKSLGPKSNIQQVRTRVPATCTSLSHDSFMVLGDLDLQAFEAPVKLEQVSELFA